MRRTTCRRPRSTTRKPRSAPADGSTVEALPAAASSADDLPPPTQTGKQAAARGFQPSLKYGVDDLLLEVGALPDATEADTYSTLRAKAYVLWQPSREWEFRAGARVDGARQDGGVADHNDLLADYTDTYVRYRSGDTRLTLGAQTIIWGRADEIPLADRVSRADLTRFVLDDLPDRRRAELAARWEQTVRRLQAGRGVAAGVLRRAVARRASVWSPVNRTTGEIIGIAPSPTVAALVKNAAHQRRRTRQRRRRGAPDQNRRTVRFRRDPGAYPAVAAVLPARRYPGGPHADRGASVQQLRRRRHGTGARRPHLAHGTGLHR